MDILEKLDMFLIGEKKSQAEWMKAYETLLSKRGDHQAGRVDWDTATYLYNTGVSPEEAVKKMQNANPYKHKGAR